MTGGSGALVFSDVGGAGSTVTGGAGGTTLFGGGNGSAITYSGDVGAAYYVAGSGNETLNATASTTNNTIIAGSGSSAFTGGSGSDTFIFYHSLTAMLGGGADLIANFSQGDRVDLVGYGTDAANTALTTAVSSNGSTTIALSDNTRITFLGLTDVGRLVSQIFST